MVRKKVGLIVNPIAGLGGKVGLKGTDGEEIQKKALILGAKPISPARVIEALKQLIIFENKIKLITSPGTMGEREAIECGFKPTVIGKINNARTTAIDTINAAKLMAGYPMDLILFAGGDGTARDIYTAIGLKVPSLGIPAGVKIHSGVYAMNPKKAGDLVVKFLNDEVSFREAEVMDVDEDAFRKGKVSARLYGYLLVPYERHLVQQAKCGVSDLDEEGNLDALAEYVIESMDDDYYYILGSGTTIKSITDRLKIDKTLLGIDLIHKGKIVAMDLNEDQLLKLIEGKKVKMVVTPIGGQGYVFGRGNQQLSPKVIKQVGKNNIIIIATKSKLLSLGFNRTLLVDTGDEEVDLILSGYSRVVTGYKEEIVMKVST